MACQLVNLTWRLRPDGTWEMDSQNAKEFEFATHR